MDGPLIDEKRKVPGNLVADWGRVQNVMGCPEVR
jgi:hypothetical protein